MGSIINTPMTRVEALSILAIPEVESAEKLEQDQEHTKVMERFETLFEKNLPEKGGSFYVQSKIYFAKEFLMQDFPPELNSSQFNPGSKHAAEEPAAEHVKEEEKK